MDPNALTRKAVDTVRYVQALLLAVATVTPLVSTYVEDINGVAEGVVTAVSAIGGLVALLLELRKRSSVTPVNDPVVPKGVVVGTYNP